MAQFFKNFLKRNFNIESNNVHCHQMVRKCHICVIKGHYITLANLKQTKLKSTPK